MSDVKLQLVLYIIRKRNFVITISSSFLIFLITNRRADAYLSTFCGVLMLINFDQLLFTQNVYRVHCCWEN